MLHADTASKIRNFNKHPHKNMQIIMLTKEAKQGSKVAYFKSLLKANSIILK